ncbi:hypothetical protein [Corynebacterium hadale]|uniref:hypothetical protein n=1 Tax=Corynebacterium hadale TaxID=2026255 RepID=UPI000BAA731A|nr:hypothetical protein [Corynebacterium hadale]PAT11647.1 hypothetical protein CKJ83_10555 [Corynebacterium hadale]
MKIDLFRLEAQLLALANRLVAAAERIAENEELTPVGMANYWKEVSPVFKDDVAKCMERVEAARLGVSRMYDYARTAAAGTPPDPAAPDTAVELALARLLARHDKWGVKEFTDTLTPIKGTPLAAALADELTARGALEPGLADAVLESLTPDMAEARHIQQYLDGMLRTAIDPLIAEIDNLMEVGPLAKKVPVTGRLRDNENKIERVQRTTLADMAGEGTLIVHETGQLEYKLPHLHAITVGVETEE